ncbi:MAG: twin-arginine translocase TatA/TatE family subunit [Austwickia sp.]|jgi:sec-independent protein translocase protein TatB|nr:twin-arginine translocase TatA/TatE family subunit [Austwickia sp.]MBK8435985.1 twin-arginine translocase TatA/TatE family subunit [Austwickia sp.]MBK9101664.1 twin-arginine translocase TatA/TatE family subunit [Austwickia sp.]
MFFDVNAWEAVIIIVLGFVLIGPDRLPEYAAKLGRAVRQLKQVAEGAKGQLREQMGPEFDDIDWAAYDPRQYDPRRIVRDALATDDTDGSRVTAAVDGDESGYVAPVGFDPSRPTPYDPDAT